MELNKIYEGNALDVLKTFPDEIIDLTVTSPPYDNLRTYKGYSFDFEGIAKELFRVTKQGGVVVWVVGDATINGSETGTSFKQALFFKEIGFNLHDTMIYHKNGLKFPSSTRYYQCFEYMFVFSKGNPKTFNPLKDRKNTYIGQKIARKSSDRGADGKLKENGAFKNHPDKTIQNYGTRFNIWSYLTGGADSGSVSEHPAIFPEKLAGDHIRSWSNKSDLVLDCFMGSGTTAKMALINDCKFVGIEISPEYIEIANKRLAPILKQKRLF